MKKKQGFFERMSVTNLIVILNVFLFALFSLASVFYGEKVFDYIALKPSLFVMGYVWTLLTSMFMHGGLTHLFVNMVSLYFVGTFVERLIGRKRYIKFYLISGIVAGLAFVLFAYLGVNYSWGTRAFGSIDSFAVGASGAIFALAGLLAVILPNLRVLVFFVIPARLWIAMIVLMFGFWAISIAGDLPIGNTAHFGGLLCGLAYGIYLRLKYPKKVNLLNRMLR